MLVVFRATPAEREDIANYADKKHDGNVSEALRLLIRTGLDVEDPVLEEV